MYMLGRSMLMYMKAETKTDLTGRRGGMAARGRWCGTVVIES